MAFPIEFIESVKAANPLDEVMGNYVTLKRNGRDYVCLCPFHNEKTPSCHIYTDSDGGSFYCFGCHEHGDVITFVMKYQNLGYPDAVRYLAERANINMPIDSYGGTSAVSTKKRFYEMNKAAARFFYEQLKTPEGKVCLDYLIRVRGLSVETIKHYGLGFAPNSWTALKNHMMSLGYKEDELVKGSLISRSKNNTKRTFDFFVNRAIFPFIGLTGNIVGFGGRTLADDNRKYVNSSDTPVYDKKKFLFSMNFAKNEATKKGYVILCEGNLDVISLAQAGFENTVASCGTALTAEQVQLISNYAKEVMICYDSDEAGQRATQKAIDLLARAGIKSKIITVTGAKDPDEFVKKYGSGKFERLIQNAEGAVEYRLSRAKDGLNLKLPNDKLEYKDRALKILGQLTSATERETYAGMVAQEIGVSDGAMQTDVSSVFKKNVYSQKKRENREAVNAVSHHRNSGEENAEGMIISYLFSNPEYYEFLKEKLPPEKFLTEFNRRVYTYLMNAIGHGEDYSLNSMDTQFNEDEIKIIEKMTRRFKNEAISREGADDCVEYLLKYWRKEEFKKIETDEDLARLFKEGKKSW